ncbi:hypothetical protein M0802_012878 [Mischocyttarus mexicanus]|nr:hypothetical protein M0802_012878 [Mischocyttarus mexicanus]
MDAMLTETLRILCEVETMMTNLGMNIPTSHKSVIVTENRDWSKEGDLTLLLIQDWGILRIFRVYLNDWKNAFRNATMKGPGTCVNGVQKPPILRPRKNEETRKKNIKNPNPRRRKIKKVRKERINRNCTDSVRLSLNQTVPLIRGGRRLCPRKRLTRRKQITVQATNTTQSTTIHNFE